MGAGGERIKTDMDYDEMISALEGYFEGKDLKHGDALRIADGIKTLLAERDDSRLTPKMVTCPGGWKGIRLTRYYCPQCKKAVRNDEAYCHKCGQAILFPKHEYDKENNKIWLNFEL